MPLSAFKSAQSLAQNWIIGLIEWSEHVVPYRLSRMIRVLRTRAGSEIQLISLDFMEKYWTEQHALGIHFKRYENS